MPIYSLQDVCDAAMRQDIEYRGRYVTRDTVNLGYGLEDVAKCLMNLKKGEFHKSHYYEDRPADDAYRTSFPRPDGDGEEMDELYVKFSLSDGCLSIDLGSFHSH